MSDERKINTISSNHPQKNTLFKTFSTIAISICPKHEPATSPRYRKVITPSSQ